MRLRGKVVFITDADSQSGKTVMTRFADEGAHFLLNSASDGSAIVSELQYLGEAGSKALVAAIDLCSSETLRTLLDRAASEIGSVDVLIHNNNLALPISVETGEEDVFLDMLRTNAKTAFVCTQAVGRHIEARQSGRVIYVTSIHAEKPTGSTFAYSVSQGAVKLLAREAALVLGRSGATVNTIEMGPVQGDNQIFRSEISALYDNYEYKVPNAVLGDYGDLAELALFLASDEARYVNGADIRLDGGFLNHYMDHRMKRPADKEA